MKNFWIVLKYELKEYFSSKGFMIFTFLLAIGGALLLCLPRFIDLSNLTGVQVVQKEETSEEEEQKEKDLMVYLDQAGVMEESLLAAYFPNVTWQQAQTEEELSLAVRSREAEAGFVITAPTQYEYYVYNLGMRDNNSAIFEQVLKQLYRVNYCAENNLDLAEISNMYDVPVEGSSQVLNKDTGSNYWYCYALVIIVFMLIVFYGQMIAVSVTNEKSNRAIEVLVTSTSPNSLLFGKVIAGAIGGLFQVGFTMGSILLSYQFNREQWGGILDLIFAIPSEVILSFAFFGLGGYLFYGFLFGAMGALVSKTEDVSKSSGSLMMVIMVVYFFALFQLQNVEGPIIKVLSFLPFSSYSTMFARIAMGTVAPWEMVLSFAILVLSIFAVGVLGAKLYRMGTLRYGNPIKLTTALRDLKKGE